MKKKNFQTNAYCRNTSLTSCPCDYRATWILGCEERVRDQPGGAGPGDVAIMVMVVEHSVLMIVKYMSNIDPHVPGQVVAIVVMVMMEVVEHSVLIAKRHPQ